jgi:hypothetical protein
MVSIGYCSERPILLAQCQLIYINKLVSEEEQGLQLSGGSIKQNESYEKSQELKDRSEKF